jgi:HEPN domain-containing protein
MKPVVKEWLDYAQKDLKAAEILISDSDLTATACFHSQQCVEKCLKAVVETKGQNPPKSHDLIRLYGMVEPFLEQARRFINAV